MDTAPRRSSWGGGNCKARIGTGKTDYCKPLTR